MIKHRFERRFGDCCKRPAPTAVVRVESWICNKTASPAGPHHFQSMLPIFINRGTGKRRAHCLRLMVNRTDRRFKQHMTASLSHLEAKIDITKPDRQLVCVEPA